VLLRADESVFGVVVEVLDGVFAAALGVQAAKAVPGVVVALVGADAVVLNAQAAGGDRALDV